MIPAITSPASSPSYSGSGTALQGQLASYERELSACVNCSTAETTEGRQKIQEVASQIEQIKARIEQATQAQGTLRTAPGSIAASAPGSVVNSESAPDSRAQPPSRIGNLIDILV